MILQQEKNSENENSDIKKRKEEREARKYVDIALPLLAITNTVLAIVAHVTMWSNWGTYTLVLLIVSTAMLPIVLSLIFYLSNKDRTALVHNTGILISSFLVVVIIASVLIQWILAVVYLRVI